MPSPRQDILQRLLARIGTIQKANGYSTDAGLSILFGETPMLGPSDPEAAVALLVRDDQIENLGGQGADDIVVQLPVEVQAIAKASQGQPGLTLEAVIADVKRAVEQGDRCLDGLLTRDMLRGRTRTLPREPGATSIGAGVGYTMFYLDPWNS